MELHSSLIMRRHEGRTQALDYTVLMELIIWLLPLSLLSWPCLLHCSALFFPSMHALAYFQRVSSPPSSTLNWGGTQQEAIVGFDFTWLFCPQDITLQKWGIFQIISAAQPCNLKAESAFKSRCQNKMFWEMLDFTWNCNWIYWDINMRR